MLCCLCDLLQLLAALAAVLLLLVAVIAHVTARKMPNLHRHEAEKFFVGNNGEKKPFPSIHDRPEKDLSVVVPAYNEEARLPVMMDEAMQFLEKRQKQRSSFKYEVIIVDDGSSDKTTQVALNYSKKYGSDKVRVLTLGVLVSRGKIILMADADGATKFADLENVEAGLNSLKPWPDNLAIACGSRAHLEKESIANRSMFRTVLMYGFHFLVWFLCVRGVRDTQCGFKLFSREAAARTFTALHVDRWAFDVELLYIAQCLKIPIAEIAVNWTEIEGSKLVPFWSWLQMGRDLLFIRLRYLTGAWKMDTTGKLD
ncbi:hypothetical protein GDO81_004850 [Engystomops pustulosus]|uniref:Dolichyl-phosphate beta-glucosyltransferase n=1 Tax=Engystomops pustulosus TaxID=76066 RepID=A0AAV7CIV3_ENGPU|nr:hypothetical protein GDO81_004850 [Engystomops pustulosus]